MLSNQATSHSVDAVERQSFRKIARNSVEGLVDRALWSDERGRRGAGGRSRTRKKQAPFCLSKKNKRTIIFRPRLGSAWRASSIPYLYLLSILSSVNPPFSPWQIYHPRSFQSCLALHAQCSSSHPRPAVSSLRRYSQSPHKFLRIYSACHGNVLSFQLLTILTGKQSQLSLIWSRLDDSSAAVDVG